MAKDKEADDSLKTNKPEESKNIEDLKEIVVKEEIPFHTSRLGCRQGTALGCIHYARYLFKDGKVKASKKYLKKACKLGHKEACNGDDLLTGNLPSLVLEGLVDKSTPVPTYGSSSDIDSKSKMYMGKKENSLKKRDPSQDQNSKDFIKTIKPIK